MSPRRNPPRDIPRLSRDTIVEEGIRLLGEAGLEGLSLRRLAARLQVQAPSLYWHVPDKSTLLAAMLERMFCRCLDEVPAQHRWQDWMRAFAESLWRTQDGIRDFARLLLTTPMDEAGIARVEARIATCVGGLDIAPKDALRIQGSVQVLMTGWHLFAHTPFAPALSRRMNFRLRALHDLELLLQGETEAL